MRDLVKGLEAVLKAVQPGLNKFFVELGGNIMVDYALDDSHPAHNTPVYTGALRSAGSFFVDGKFKGQTRKFLTGLTVSGRPDYYPPLQNLSTTIANNTSVLTIYINTPYAASPSFDGKRGPHYLMDVVEYDWDWKVGDLPKIFMGEIAREVARI